MFYFSIYLFYFMLALKAAYKSKTTTT